MISSVLKFEPNRAIPAPQRSQNINYKQLYQQCKQNVALFMKQVDKEISTILKNHEEQKKKLQLQINSLKIQLQASKNDVSIVVRENSSYKSIPAKQYNSEIKERNNTSVSKQTVEECLAKFSGFDIKTIVSDKKTSIEGSMLDDTKERRRSVLKTYYEEKENNFCTSQLNQKEQIEDIKIQPLRLVTSNLPTRRQKRLKEKKSVEQKEKAQNIKDVLKNIRGKLNSNDKAKYFRSKAEEEEEKSTLSIITPDIFKTSRSVKN